MDIEGLIGSVIRGALVGRRKRHHNVMRYLDRRSGLLGPGTLLALAGVAWGVYETMTKKNEVFAATSPAAGMPPSASGRASAGPPPLPQGVAAPASAPPDAPPSGAHRIVALLISAARADGTLSDAERGAILEQATAAGAEALVRGELTAPHPLSQIVAGVTDPAQRAELYRLAFAVVRADDGVTGAERIYLAQLAHQLGLDPEAAAAIERDTASGIDAAGVGPEGQ